MGDLISVEDDFAAFYGDGGDPDRSSQRLYEWHQRLWGRHVDGLTPFTLELVLKVPYGIHLTTASEEQFWLSSDSMINTWSTPRWTRRFSPDVAAEAAANRDGFHRYASTIGGYILWPLNRSGQTGHSINQARGVSRAIEDRFDLTLECVRRHYEDHLAANPLGDRLAAYADFFALFKDFDTYVRFWLLDDLVSEDRGGVVSLFSGEVIRELPTQVLPTSAEEYTRFRRNAMDFLAARNMRITNLGI